VREERGGGESGKAAVRLRLEKTGVKGKEGSLFLDREGSLRKRQETI